MHFVKSEEPTGHEPEQDGTKASFAIAYAVVAFSGFLIGLLSGWFLWG